MFEKKRKIEPLDSDRMDYLLDLAERLKPRPPIEIPPIPDNEMANVVEAIIISPFIAQPVKRVVTDLYEKLVQGYQYSPDYT